MFYKVIVWHNAGFLILGTCCLISFNLISLFWFGKVAQAASVPTVFTTGLAPHYGQ